MRPRSEWYFARCNFEECEFRATDPSPYRVINRLRNHEEKAHQNECCLCPWVAGSEAEWWSHMGKHKIGESAKQTPTGTGPVIIYECPMQDWKSAPLPFPQAERAYLEHLHQRHGGGLACAFCGLWLPDWGPLAYHVRTACREKAGPGIRPDPRNRLALETRPSSKPQSDGPTTDRLF